MARPALDPHFAIWEKLWSYLIPQQQHVVSIFYGPARATAMLLSLWNCRENVGRSGRVGSRLSACFSPQSFDVFGVSDVSLREHQARKLALPGY